MIIIGTPKDVSKYIVANNIESHILNKLGFFAKYKDDKFSYYVKTEEIEKAYINALIND